MLEKIKSVADLQKLEVKDLPVLCNEIREKLVSVVMNNGGHLASNLGAVELNVALHYVYGENDKIVWDVGHQSYVHKILTGRGDSFDTIRQQNGISGFPNKDESESDLFTVGHAGTAISQAVGLCRARDILDEKYKVVAVVGDGSFTCGETYEALNNSKDTDLLVVLNDNNMSISESVGTATLNLSKLRVGKYDRNKKRLKRFLHAIPLVGKPFYNFLKWCKQKAKLKFYRNSYFDNFDVKYVGIIDGNEIENLVYYLKKIKENVTKPTVLHIITKKGKGFELAENDPEKYHSVPIGGNFVIKKDSAQVVSETLCNIADENKKICCVTAAMGNSVGFGNFAKKFPERCFDVGIAEEHAVTFAGGLAKGGMKPFVGIYSTFLQRSYDQILHDIALQNLPVTFLIDRAGFVGEDGKTHQGLFDLSYLSNIPNLRIWTPRTYLQLSEMIEKSVLENCPVAIRYPRYLSEDSVGFEDWNEYGADSNVLMFAVGPNMFNVARKFEDKCKIFEITYVKPLNLDVLNKLFNCSIVTLEENVVSGGFGQTISAYFSERKDIKVVNLGVNDCFVEHGSFEQQILNCGLDEKSVGKVVDGLLN